MDVATTLHSTLFRVKHLSHKWLQDVGYLSTLHLPYIRPTQIQTQMNRSSYRNEKNGHREDDLRDNEIFNVGMM